MAPSFDELWDSLPGPQQGLTPTATASPSTTPVFNFDEAWDSIPTPSTPQTAAASGFLNGVASLGDLAYLGISAINSRERQLQSAMGIQAHPSIIQNLGDLLRQTFDTASGVKDSTKIGEDTYPYKFASYLPGTLLGPGGIIGKLAINTTSSAGGYIGNKIGGAPGEIIGALAGGVGPSLAKYGLASVYRSLVSTPEEAAARKLQSVDPQAILNLTEDASNPLAKYQTLAETTQSPKIAQLEQELGKSFPEANARAVANETARRATQKEMLEALSNSAVLPRDESGTLVRKIIDKEATHNLKEAERLFSGIDREAQVPISSLRENSNKIAASAYEAGGMPSQIKGLISELNKGDVIKEGPLAGSEILPETKPFSYMHALRQRAQKAWVDAKIDGDKTAATVAQKIWDGVDDSISRAQAEGTMTAKDVNKFAAGKRAFSKYMDTFESGPIGYVRQKIKEGAYQIPESSVVNTVWNGTAEKTKALLNAIPKDEASVDALRGVVRDKLIRDVSSNDGNLRPSEFRKFLRKNLEGLTAYSDDGRTLFDRDHIKTLERVADDLAFLDPQSNKSVRGLAYRPSKGQSTTAQALLMSQVGSKVLGGKVELFKEFFLRPWQEKVNGILTEAIYNKDFAKALVKLPTPDTLTNSLKNLIGTTASSQIPALSQSYENSLPDTKPRETLRASQGGLPSYQNSASPAQLVDPKNFGVDQFPSQDITNRALLKREDKPQIQGAQKRIDTSSSNSTSKLIPSQSKNVKDLISQLPPQVRAVIHVESRGNPNAVSPKGAVGLMQIMPSNLEAMGLDGRDPVQNVQAGIKLLQEYWSKYKDERLQYAAYNAGPKKVDAAIRKAGSRNYADVAKYLPAETKQYVLNVKRKIAELET